MGGRGKSLQTRKLHERKCVINLNKKRLSRLKTSKCEQLDNLALQTNSQFWIYHFSWTLNAAINAHFKFFLHYFTCSTVCWLLALFPPFCSPYYRDGALRAHARRSLIGARSCGKVEASAFCCAVAQKLVRMKLWQTSLNVRHICLKYLSSMLRTNSSDVWRGGWKRQRGERTPLRVSLPAAVCLCSTGFTFLCAALRPLLLRLSAAGGHRPALPRFCGVPSCVSGESDSRGHLTPFTDKVPSGHRGHWLSDSFAAKRAARRGVRPLRWSVPQVERTTSRERWALSAPRRGLPPGSRGPGPEEPLLCWAHLWVQLRHHVSHPCIFTHKLFSFFTHFTHHYAFGSVLGFCHYLQMCLAKEGREKARCFHD